MPNKQLAAMGIAVCMLILGCNRRQVPEQSTATTVTTRTSNNTANNNTIPVRRTDVKRTAPMAAPKVIAVNDKAAKKSFDGRLYYDINGRRYWKNYDDGKYYLFDKSMYTNRAFKPHE